MNQTSAQNDYPLRDEILTSEFLILPDGRVLAHNLTPILAKVLAEINLEDNSTTSRRTTLEKQNDKFPD